MKQKKIIRLAKVSAEELQKYEEQGHVVMIVSDVDKRVQALESATQTALSKGNKEQAKMMRLKMLRLINNKGK